MNQDLTRAPAREPLHPRPPRGRARGRRHLRRAAVGAVLLLAACAQPADPAALADAGARWGSAPQHVLTTSAGGFDSVPMAAGVYGADGFSLMFVSPDTGSQFLLTATSGEMTADDCASAPVTDTGGGSVEGEVTCAAEDDLFYRVAGGAAEYVVVRDDTVVRISGAAADRDALREAAEHVRVPTGAELDALLAEAPTVQDPVERGDLPPGDGAPDNGVGTGG